MYRRVKKVYRVLSKKWVKVRGEWCKSQIWKWISERQNQKVLKVRGCRDAASGNASHQNSVYPSDIHSLSQWSACLNAQIPVWCSGGDLILRRGWKANVMCNQHSHRERVDEWCPSYVCVCVTFFYNAKRMICLLIAVAKVTYSSCMYCYAASGKTKPVQVYSKEVFTCVCVNDTLLTVFNGLSPWNILSSFDRAHKTQFKQVEWSHIWLINGPVNSVCVNVQRYILGVERL